MSERGSFVTEYIYDEELFDICKEVLKGDWKYFRTRQIGELPIIAGKIGGMYDGEEIDEFKYNIIPDIQEKMKPNMYLRLVVLSDCCGECLFYITKDKIEKIQTNEYKRHHFPEMYDEWKKNHEETI